MQNPLSAKPRFVGRQSAVAWLLAPLVLAIAGLMLMVPGKRRLPRYRRSAVSGVLTISDAIADCRRSGLNGWDLVLYAQQMTTRKFTTYSTLNAWDNPARAFEFGIGYCTQYNLALKRILHSLGFSVSAVFAFKVRDLDEPRWTMGHTWLRVAINGETRDVCAGSLSNLPGQVNFLPLSRIYAAGEAGLLLTQLGLILFVGFLEWRALLTRVSPPWWSYQPRP